MIGQTVKYISQHSSSGYFNKTEVCKTALILDKVRVGIKNEVEVQRPDGKGYGKQKHRK